MTDRKVQLDELKAMLHNFPIFQSPSGEYQCTGCGKVLSQIKSEGADNVEALRCDAHRCSREGDRYEYMDVLYLFTNYRDALS